MDIQDLGALGEFLGSIAVLVSLIYLALQIRQNTEAERRTTYQSVVSDFSMLSQTMVATPGMSRLFAQGMEDFEGLEADDKARLAQILFACFHCFENMYYQHKKGYLEDDVWSGWKNLMMSYFERPGVQSWWRLRRAAYSPSFAHFLESTEYNGAVATFREVVADGGPKT